MPPMKRKAEELGKSTRDPNQDGSSSSGAQKRQREEASSISTKKKRGNPIDRNAEVPRKKVSLLQEEEKSFPRGGGGVLTPLEHKQIELQATRDVLFEEAGRTPGKASSIGFDEDEASKTNGARDSSSKPNRKARLGRQEATTMTEPNIRADGLKFKRLKPGSMVLGQVTKIKSNEIILDLPNNLTGTVPITAISKKVTEKLVAWTTRIEADEPTQDLEDVDLAQYFYLGQYLRARVTSTSDDSSADKAIPKKRIELAVDPGRTNEGVTKSDVRVNSMMQASIVSIEDHGIVMDLGLAGSDIKGFISSEEIPEVFEYSRLKDGSVYLCLVTGLGSNGKVVKMTAKISATSEAHKHKVLREAPTINPFLPGTAVELLISQVTSSTVSGKLMGLVNASADVIHSGAASSGADLTSKYKAGDKINARIIFTLQDAERNSVGVSLLAHVYSLSPKFLSRDGSKVEPTQALPLSSHVEKARVKLVEPALGVYADVGVDDVPAFVHVSRLSDGKVDSLAQKSGAYRVGSTHRSRILDFNAVDGVFVASFETAILEQKYLRIEDISIGEVVKGKVERLYLNSKGVGGVIVKLAEGITGLVPEIHMSDVQLQHPELKFKEGIVVTARILSIDSGKRQVRLTLKKSLVNTDAQIWSSYDEISPGSHSLGTLLKVTPDGAIVQFYGDMTAYLPVSEMSEAFIEDATKHFRPGQVVGLYARSVNPVDSRMIVSCRPSLPEDSAQAAAFDTLKIGNVVRGTIVDKSLEDVKIEMADLRINATLRVGHLTDGSAQKNDSAMKQMRTGQKLHDLLVIGLFPKRRSVILSKKPSLLQAVKRGNLISKFEQITLGANVDGFVRDVTQDGVFVEFPGGLTSLLPRSQLDDKVRSQPDLGFVKDQSVSARVLSIDPTLKRFALTFKTSEKAISVGSPQHTEVATSDFSIGKVTTATVSSVKDTQINVTLTDKVQGRIDISEAFGSWDEIKDRKRPLRTFHPKDKIHVRVIGIHDARNHRFLPISHRTGKVPILELSAKLQDDQSIISLNQVAVGSWYVAFVNNVVDECVWVNLSPNVRGRIEQIDLTEDLSRLGDLEANFPVGSAIKVRARKVDVANGRLDLSAKDESADTELTMDTLSIGQIVTGRVTKTNERSVWVQLGPEVSGVVGLTQLADDYLQANPANYSKNDVIRVCVLEVDKPNKRVTLSSRPSKVLSSSLPVQDQSFSNVSQLKVNDVVRGFIKNITDAGIFVALGHNLTAFARVSELSDSFIKNWKASYEIDRLVIGKVISLDATKQHVQISLKSSVLSNEYIPKISFNDLKVGQVVLGKIRKVEDFGVFIVIDNSFNVSGLCHRSEMAEKGVEDARKLYEQGEAVKAIVLKLDPQKRRVSFGLKTSLFENTFEDEIDPGMSETEMPGDISREFDSKGNEVEDLSKNSELVVHQAKAGSSSQSTSSSDNGSAEYDDDDDALNAGVFNWSGTVEQAADDRQSGPHFGDERLASTIESKKTDIHMDKTGDLDRFGPQSASDFERLLLAQKDSSSLWIQYMALRLQLSEIDEARKIAERALREISIREQEEKLNVWVAYLNLENAYGSDETVQEVFQRACELHDANEMHERLTSIYIESGKLEKAGELFQVMTKKKAFSQDPKFWVNYATFLFDSITQHERARGLLDRAMKSVPGHLQRDLVCKFAQLEFRCKNGDPERGRTMFEGLIDTYPKRWDIWDILIEMEKQQGVRDNVRGLFERMTSASTKAKRARYAFKKWLEFEEEEADQKRIDHVKAKASEFVEQHNAQRDA